MNSDDEERFESADEGHDEDEDNSLLTPTQDTTQETPKSISDNKQEQQQQPETASWTGWGSFLSTAVSAVTETLSADVNSLYTTAKDLGGELKKVTDTTMDNVYGTLDPDYQQDMQQQQQNKDDTLNTDKEASDEKKVSSKVPTGSITHTTESVMKAIDTTFDFTSDLLGNAVMGGYRKLEAANISEKLDTLKQSIETNEVLHHGQAVGQTLFANGLSALEAIGSVVGVQAAESLAKAARGKSEKSVTVRTVNKKRKMTLTDYFEDNCGNAHLQALEMLSTEATLKRNAFAEPVQLKIKNDLEKLEELFDMDDLVEGMALSTVSSTFQNDTGYQHVQSLLQQIGVMNQTQLIRANEFIVKIETLISTESSAVSSLTADNDDQLQFLSKHLDTTLNDSIQSFANFSEKGCEQMLRIAEIMLMVIAEEMLKAQQAAVDPETSTVETMDSKKVITHAKVILDVALVFLKVYSKYEISLTFRNCNL